MPAQAKKKARSKAVARRGTKAVAKGGAKSAAKRGAETAAKRTTETAAKRGAKTAAKRNSGSQNAIVSKIVAMLADERLERQCAAAMVLAELRARDAAVIDALGGCLADGHPTLQRYALDALAAVRSPKVARYVTPLLDSDDDEVRLRAAALLADQGSRAAKALAEGLDSGPPGRRRAIIKILAAYHDAANLARLLALLGDPEVGEAVMHTLRGELDKMSAGARRTLHDALAKQLKQRRGSAERDPAETARAVRLLGYLRDSKLVATILPFVGADQPSEVRLAALAALRRPLELARSASKAIVRLLACADDEDESVARAAIETLRPLELSGAVQGQLEQLLDARHAETRAFAAQALARCGDRGVVATLVDRLGSDDPATREAASRALSRRDDVAPALVAQLHKRSDDPQAVERLVRLLGRLGEQLTPRARKTICEAAVVAIEEQRPTAGPLQRLARNIDAGAFGAMLSERALKHRRARRFPQAFELLARIGDSGLLDEDARYAALVSGLNTLSSKKGLARSARSTDPVLKHATQLVQRGFPVASRLKRERSLSAEDLFFVGFNFVESHDEDERDFGEALLAHLAKSSPRSKLGRSAKNKLRLVGLG